jgi:hypothetical protein
VTRFRPVITAVESNGAANQNRRGTRAGHRQQTMPAKSRKTLQVIPAIRPAVPPLGAMMDETRT